MRMEHLLRMPGERELIARDRQVLQPVLAQLGSGLAPCDGMLQCRRPYGISLTRCYLHRPLGFAYRNSPRGLLRVITIVFSVPQFIFFVE